MKKCCCCRAVRRRLSPGRAVHPPCAEDALAFDPPLPIVDIDRPAVAGLGHDDKAEAADRQPIADQHAGIALEDRAAQIGRCGVQQIAAISGHDLRRNVRLAGQGTKAL